MLYTTPNNTLSHRQPRCSIWAIALRCCTKILLLPALWLLTAGALHAADDSAQAAERGSPPMIMLGVGDAISVQVYGNPELSTTAYVDDDGSVAVPLAGTVEVAGMSPSVAAEKIAAAFRARQLLVDPQVTVFMVESRSQMVSVLGAVGTPGRYPIQSNSTLLDVVAQAGGVSEDGGHQVVIIRRDEHGAITRNSVDLHGLDRQGSPASTQLQLRSGDSIFVPNAQTFSIYGEINAPNSYPLNPGMTVVEAISLGGGLTPRGSRNRIEIRRKQGEGSFTTRAASLDDRVEPGDVIRIKGRLF